MVINTLRMNESRKSEENERLATTEQQQAAKIMNNE